METETAGILVQLCQKLSKAETHKEGAKLHVKLDTHTETGAGLTKRRREWLLGFAQRCV